MIMTSLCLRYPKLTTLVAITWLAWVVFIVMAVLPADAYHDHVVMKCKPAQLVALTPNYLILSQGNGKHKFHFPWSSNLMKASRDEIYHICTDQHDHVVTVFVPKAI